ncbi:hypothetical protein AOG23_29660 [Rhizobium acidisoli]|nr:hypothetical protein AOG23_29660 [Rhizobium acidisoli]
MGARVFSARYAGQAVKKVGSVEIKLREGGEMCTGGSRRSTRVWQFLPRSTIYLLGWATHSGPARKFFKGSIMTNDKGAGAPLSAVSVAKKYRIALEDAKAIVAEHGDDAKAIHKAARRIAA